MSKIACDACRLPECICPTEAPVASRIELVVVRHFLERWKISGTARLLPMAIASAAIIDVGGPGVPTSAAAIEPRPGTYVLFPGGVEIGRVADSLARLVIPDGTWTQAKRLRARLPWLAALPSVTLPPGPPPPALRKPRYPGEMPTAVAVAAALEACGELAAADRLAALYAQMHWVLTRPGRS